jgi:hypothetical protein
MDHRKLVVESHDVVARLPSVTSNVAVGASANLL